MALWCLIVLHPERNSRTLAIYALQAAEVVSSDVSVCRSREVGRLGERSLAVVALGSVMVTALPWAVGGG